MLLLTLVIDYSVPRVLVMKLLLLLSQTWKLEDVAESLLDGFASQKMIVIPIHKGNLFIFKINQTIINILCKAVSALKTTII